MNPRVNYEMTQEDLDAILAACKPTPVIFGTGGVNLGGDQQDNANHAWAKLGEKMGFDPMTVRPVASAGMRFFTAVPSETAAQRTERVARETEERREAEIANLDKEISERTLRRDALLAERTPV